MKLKLFVRAAFAALAGLSSCVNAEVDVSVTTGSISQVAEGANVLTEINIGSITSRRVSRFDTEISVDGVSMLNSGGISGKSLVNIGSSSGDGEGKSLISVSGGIYLVGDGEINLGSLK